MLRSAVPVLFLLVLVLSGSDGGFIYQTVREGDDVTLSCENVLPDQSQCQFTDWFLSKNKQYTNFFTRGEKRDGVSSSVRLLQNCSLVLNSVTVEQFGTYVCDQNKKHITHTSIQLFVASLSQEIKDDRVTLTCSVATTGQCVHEVKWLNNSKEVTKDNEELRISPLRCSVSVVFKDQSPPPPFYQTLKCEVRQRHTDQLFSLSPRAPDDQTTTATSSDETPVSSALLLVVVPVVLAVALVVAVVALILCRRHKGHRDTNRDAVSPEDAVTYASVHINQKNNNKKNLQSRDREEDVTYSSVNVSSQVHPTEHKPDHPEDSVTYTAVHFDQKKKKKKKKEESGAEEENVTYSCVNVAEAGQLYSSVHKAPSRNEQL